MVVIMSNRYETTTDYVIDWIKHYDTNYLRLNTEDEIHLNDIELNSEEGFKRFELSVNGKIYDLTNTTAFWYRKGEPKISYELPQDTNLDSYILEEIKHHLEMESNKLNQLLYYYLKTKRSLCSFYGARVNKLIILSLASQVGLDIPSSFITTKKKSIEQKINQKSEIVTKGIWENFYLQKKQEFYQTYTEAVRLNNLDKMENRFFPSLIQENIEKKYELRVFFINNKLFSTAILSQNNPKTQQDFRKYDDENPNRVVPYKIPKIIEKKIVALMNLVKLNTGSIDLMVTKDNRYIFLEVNPVGQFIGMVEHPCNFLICKEIAAYLCQTSI